MKIALNQKGKNITLKGNFLLDCIEWNKYLRLDKEIIEKNLFSIFWKEAYFLESITALNNSKNTKLKVPWSYLLKYHFLQELLLALVSIKFRHFFSFTKFYVFVAQFGKKSSVCLWKSYYDSKALMLKFKSKNCSL